MLSRKDQDMQHKIAKKFKNACVVLCDHIKKIVINTPKILSVAVPVSFLDFL